MPNSSPPTEQWIRVVCYLPVSPEYRFDAFNRIIRYVHRLRKSKSALTGLTQVEKVTGQWWSTATSKWVDDTITLLILDFKGTSEDVLLLHRIARIRRFAFACYRHFDPDHIGEDEIWLTQQDMTRFSGP